MILNLLSDKDDDISVCSKRKIISCLKHIGNSLSNYFSLIIPKLTDYLSSLINKIKSTEDRVEKCLLGHKLAIKVFDTSTFKPFEVLPYRPLCNEPQDCFLIKDFLPAYYYGYEDSKYSPRHNKRIFKLRADCFRGTNPVIGVRNDGSWLVRNTPEAGLDYYEDKQTDKYGIWQFFRINTGTIDEEGFAVFTNDLEKEFSVEIAHLTEDGTLHRIYHLHS